MTRLIKTSCKLMAMLLVANGFLSVPASAGQGAQRMLYTVPNSSFIINPSGDSTITINDTSGSIATLQTAINNARAANPSSIIVVHLMSGAVYSVSSSGLVLGSQECLIGSGATIQAANTSVTSPLVTITNGAANVSIAGGTYDANGANIYGIYAPSSAARVNIDKVTVLNCGQDGIQLNGNGSGTFDNEMTVTRCELSGSSNHSGISIWNATQATCVDNFCHGNSVGIWIGNGGYCNIANNVCISNSTGIDCNSGSDNYIVNNTCVNNGTGVYAGGSANMIVSDLLASNSVAGINSSGSGNIFSDNSLGGGNASNFLNNGSGDMVVAYQGTINASGQNYFYPPLINDQHSMTIVNGLGRYDLYDNSTGPIDNVQSEYNDALSANPGSVIVLHLNGNYTIGSSPLSLSSYTCVLLGGTIQINSSTSAGQAIYANGASHISISGGTIDGGTTSSSHAGHNAIYFTGCSMFQIDAMTLQNFGTRSTRVGGSDVVRIDHGSTPRIFTRNTIVNGSARGFWLATSGVRDIVSDNTVSGVQMDGIDCDASTYASVVKFNYSHDNSRCGVFVEQSASYNLLLGNICNYNGHDLDLFNNSSTPRSPVAFNSLICNACWGGNLLQSGSTGDGSSVTSSDNFIFGNTFVNGSVNSTLYGAANYFSQNYLSGVSLNTTPGVQDFFNPPGVAGYLRVQDAASGWFASVPGAALTNNAPVVIGPTNANGGDQWALVPTDSGFFQIKNKNSDLDMNVAGASTNLGASVIQWPFGSGQNDQWMPVAAGNGLWSFENRLSGLSLAVPGMNSGTQLVQQSPGVGGQQFALLDVPQPVSTVIASNSVTWTSGGAPDGNWLTAANWGGGLPQPGDGLGFGSGAQVLTTNNFPAGTMFGNLTFTTGSPAFTLGGNGVVLSSAIIGAGGSLGGGGVAQSSISNQTVNLPITLAAGAHIISTSAGAGALALTNSLVRNTGATAQFAVSGGAIGSGLGISNGIVGGWAIYSPSSSLINNSGGAGAADWAVTNGAGALAAYSSYTTLSGSGQTFANNSAANVKVTSNGSTDDKVNSGTTTINTLIWSSTTQNGYIDIPTSSTLRLGALGGIIHNDNKYLRIGNGQSGSAVTAGGADNTPGELCVYNLSYYAADAVEFWTTLANNGSAPMTLTTFGSVKIDGPNTYSGGTYINGGDFFCNGGGNTPFGTGPVYVLPGGRADLGGDNGATVTNSFFVAGQGFIANGNIAAIKGTYNGWLTGLITLMGDVQIDPNAGTWTNTCVFSGGFAGTGSLTIGGPSNVVAGIATFAGNCAHSGDTIIDATANANGGSGIFIGSGKNNILNNGGNLVLVGGSSSGKALLDLNGSTQNINGLVATNGNTSNAIVQSSSGSGTLMVGNNNANSTFGGILQNGSGILTLIKMGSGVVKLAGNNPYTGNTTISAGTLAVSGSLSNTAAIFIADGATLDVSARPDQTLTLNSGQTLQGGGTVNVNLTTTPGTTVMPGSLSNIDALNITGAAQLQGTTVMKLNAMAGTADQINASTIIYGGTLTVTNLSGAFTAGQSYELFLGTYSGAFSAVILPPLGAGLAWSNNLATSGTLQVVSTVPPQLHFSSVGLSGGTLTFNGAGGQPFTQCYLLASTNLAAPAQNWTIIATNAFDLNGNFSITNPIAPNVPLNFYLLKY